MSQKVATTDLLPDEVNGVAVSSLNTQQRHCLDGAGWAPPVAVGSSQRWLNLGRTGQLHGGSNPIRDGFKQLLK